MRRSFIALAILVMALLVPSLSFAAAPPKAQPLICGSEGCGAGGGYNGCNVASSSFTDGWLNTITASYHWCWNNGSVYDNYGWSSQSTQLPGVGFAGWNYDHDYNYGHTDQGRFYQFITPWIYSTLSVCVGVDGYGRSWRC